MTPKAWLALIAVYTIWGSTYLAIRFAIETLPPLLMAGIRFLVAGLAMYAVGRLVGRGRRTRPTLQHWKSAAVIGICLPLGGNGLVTLAEKHSPRATGSVALLIATVPIWVAVFEWLRYRTRLSRLVVAGLLGGFAGAGLLAAARGGTSLDAAAAILSLSASAIWAAGSVYARRAQLPESPIVFTGMEMIAGGVALLLSGTVIGEWSKFHPSQVNSASILGLLYLIVAGSIIAFTSYAWLLRNVRSQIVTTYAYVNPFVAVLLGIAFNHEKLGGTSIIAGAIIIVSVAVIVVASGGEARAAAARSLEELPSDPAATSRSPRS
jgi:drug/metabolite transporter (DMT)-like permease